MLSPWEGEHAGSQDSARKRNLQRRMVEPGLGREEEGETKEKLHLGPNPFVGWQLKASEVLTSQSALSAPMRRRLFELKRSALSAGKDHLLR